MRLGASQFLILLNGEGFFSRGLKGKALPIMTGTVAQGITRLRELFADERRSNYHRMAASPEDRLLEEEEALGAYAVAGWVNGVVGVAAIGARFHAARRIHRFKLQAAAAR